LVVKVYCALVKISENRQETLRNPLTTSINLTYDA